MRRVVSIVLLLSFVFGRALVFAEQQTTPTPTPTPSTETVVVKKSDLTPDQLAKLKLEEVGQQLGAYREYAEMGRGIGLAIRESLTSVKDVAVEFSQTPVGKFTLFLIAWKVMAKDVIDMGDKVIAYLIGVPLYLIGGVVLVWSYRRQCIVRRVLVEKSKEGKKWALVTPNGQVVNITDPDGGKHQATARSEWAIGHVIVGVIFFILTSILTFGC